MWYSLCHCFNKNWKHMYYRPVKRILRTLLVHEVLQLFFQTKDWKILFSWSFHLYNPLHWKLKDTASPWSWAGCNASNAGRLALNIYSRDPLPACGHQPSPVPLQGWIIPNNCRIKGSVALCCMQWCSRRRSHKVLEDYGATTQGFECTNLE